MDVLSFHSFHKQFCLNEILPALLVDVATGLQTKVKKIEITKLSSSSKLRGFHFSNVRNIKVAFEGYNPLNILIPISDENLLFNVIDTYRIFTLELAEDLFSVKQTADILKLRLQFFKKVIQSDDQGYIPQIGCYLYDLYTYFFTKDELHQMNIYFSIEPEPGLVANKHKQLTLYSQIPYGKMPWFQKTLFTSFKNKILAKKKIVKTKFKTLDLYVDPVTKLLNNVSSFKDVLSVAFNDINKQPDSSLTSTNLRYKRLRNEELILRVLYTKLLELVHYQKGQEKLRFSPDYLLSQMFVEPSLQKLFEYVTLSNAYQVVALKYKVTTLIEHMSMDLRDVDPSFMGNICVLDGPDDDNVGQKQYLSFDTEVDEFGRFI